MSVDISPNLPPSSSCTAAAEFGEGFFGSWQFDRQFVDAENHQVNL